MKLELLWQAYTGKTIGESRVEKWKNEILPQPYQPLNHYEGEIDLSWQKQWNKHPSKAFKGIEYERVGESMKWSPRSKLRQYGINLTRKLFSQIKKLSEANNARFVIFKEERPWELKNPYKEKAYLLNGGYYVSSIRQYRENLRDLFAGFEHYRITLGIDDYKVKPEDFHLSPDAVDILLKGVSESLNHDGYLTRK